MRVLHVDRHAVLREGLRALLAEARGLDQVECVASVHDAAEVPQAHDLVILGHDEATDAEAARSVALRFPAARIVSLPEGMPAERILDLVTAVPAT